MQQELQDLQPELIKTSADTEKLMVKIEQDTVEVEAKKEVSNLVVCLVVWELKSRPMKTHKTLMYVHVLPLFTVTFNGLHPELQNPKKDRSSP